MANNDLDINLVVTQTEGDRTLSVTTVNVHYPDIPNDMANEANNGFTEALVNAGIAVSRKFAEG